MESIPADLSNALGKDTSALGNAFDETSRECRKIACGFCLKEFMQTRYWQRYCSVHCRNENFWKDKKRATIPLSPDHPNQETKTS